MREARAGDRYLLCSDGLSDPVSHETILEALQISDVAESADRLIELALRGGGPDNVTVVVADVVDYDYGQTQPILAGAVSGDDDQAAPPEHRGRSRVGLQPAPQRGQTCCRRNRKSRRASPARGAGCSSPPRCWCWSCWPASPSAARSSAATTTSPSTTARCRSCGVFRAPFSVYALQEPYLLGCLNDRNELSLISAGQSTDNLDCRHARVSTTCGRRNARRSSRACRRAPRRRHRPDRGTARSSVLPTCATRTPTPTTTTPPPAPHPPAPRQSGHRPNPAATARAGDPDAR